MTKIKELWNGLSRTVVICLVIYGIITVGSNAMTEGLSDQQAAKRWSADGGFAQVSCFFSDGVVTDDFVIQSFEKQLESALKEAAVTEEENSRLYVSAYSTEGKITVASEQTSLEASAIGIGGDFFLFHPLTLLSGGYFSGNDLMKDFILLDEDAAWRLFGSYDVEGMSVMIGGVPHYVAGVYQKEEGRFQKAAGLDEIVLFLSYESLSAYGTCGSINTYELVAPNPVKNFVLHTAKEKFGLTEEEMTVIENSSRYSAEAMISVILDFGIRSMQDTAVSYPYWENIARGYEDIRAVLFVLQIIFFMIPSAIILVFLIRRGRVGMKKAGQFLKSKISVFGIFMLLTLALTGCKGSSDDNQTIASKDYVYRVEDLALEGEEQQSFTLLKGKDCLYAYSYHYGSGEELKPWIDFYTMDEEGNLIEKKKLTIDENSNLYSICVDNEKNIYAINDVYATEPDADGVYRDKYYLVKLSEQGEELFRVNLSELPEFQEQTQDYFYVNNLVVIEDAIYVSAMERCVRFNTEGKVVNTLEADADATMENATLYALENGRIGAVTYEEDGVYAAYIDLETGAVTQKTKIPGSSYEFSFYAGIGYDFYLVNSYGVYGYNIGKEEKTQLMNYIDSDLGVYNVFNVIPIDETSFFASYDDMVTYDMKMGKFTKVPPQEVKDKIGLTLACAGIGWNVRTAVVDFNKNNEEYRIRIEDYSSLYGDDSDYMAGINRLNADIVAGKIPDILLIDSSMPVDSYISKGLFEDIKPYIEADEELDMNDFLPNIIEAYSVDGKLYQVVPSFMIHTLLVKTSDVGNRKGWSVGDVREILASKPEGTEFFTYVTRDQILRDCIITDGQFINWKTGQCNFNAEGFIELLEFAATFPEEVDNTAYDDDYWMNYESQWREGRVLCQQTTLADFRNYNYTAKGSFGEPVTMIGYPVNEGNGSAIIANTQLAMSSKSKNKEGAYSFLRYFLTDEYQQELEYGYPVSIRRLDEMAGDAMTVETYTDENGQVIEAPEIYYLNGMEIEIQPMTQAEADALKADLLSVTKTYTYDEKLMQIIDEETAAFFSGQKSAREVAEIIQSRVQIYVNESR